MIKQTKQVAPIPMVVVGGYLGAGKTTMLNRLLTQSGDLRVAVLVNDFGEINIDAALIRTRSDDVIQLENGCVCCSIGDKLVQALAEISERADRPDLLVIEASGVSDPQRIAQVGMLDRAFRLNSIVVLADVFGLQQHLADPLIGEMVRQQMTSATALVLSKCDLASESDIAAAAELLTGIAPRAVQFRADHGMVPMSVFLDMEGMPDRSIPSLLSPQPGGRWSRRSADALLHDSITSFSIRMPGEQFDKLRLKQALRNLPTGTLRAKGIVCVQGKARPQELHVVGGRLRITDAEQGSLSESVLVFIGIFAAGDEQRVRDELCAAIVEAVAEMVV